MTCEGTSPALIYIFDPSFDLKAGSISLKFSGVKISEVPHA